LEEYKKNDALNNDEADYKNNDIKLHENSKRIFINSIDEEEMNQIKESIAKLLNGSREINRIFKIKNSIYRALVEKNYKVFNTLRQNYKNLKIFSNLKNGQNIRVTGKSEEAEKAFLEIDQFFCKISNSIVLKDLELK